MVPRGVILSSDGNYAYIASSGAVSWYERNASTGALTYGGMLQDGVDGGHGLYAANSVTLSSDGNHAYVTGQFDHAVSGMIETRARRFDLMEGCCRTE